MQKRKVVPIILTVVVLAVILQSSIFPVRSQNASGIWAEILVIDSASGRGIPLVELETVNALRFVTDNAGRIAFYEPGLMGRELFFTVRSHGYEAKKDGFGFAGVRLTPKAGQVAEVKLTRRNVAERVCGLTGE